MNRAAVSIPEKLFFKIGEVCDITDVQAHVLRYWESEFPMLAPQKNRAGQRTYRKRDVEMVLRIKELLYEDQYTIAGAKKKLTSELRGASKLKVVTPEMSAPAPTGPANATTADASSSTPTGLLSTALPSPRPQPNLPASYTTPTASTNFGEGRADQASLTLNDERRAALRRLRQELNELLALIQSDDDHDGVGPQ